MRLLQLLLASSALSTVLAVPLDSLDDNLIVRDALPNPDALPELILPEGLEAPLDSELEKRKGGGGGGGGGRGGGGSSSSSSSSSGSSSSGSSSSGSSSSGSSGSRGSSSGTTSSPASFGGAYAGGARTPYSAGTRTPGGVAPFYYGAPIGAAAAGSYYIYRTADRVTYYNQTARINETHALRCQCRRYNPCGCERNPDQAYVNRLVGNGSVAALRENQVTKIGNGTLYVDGTLRNGTSSTSSAPTLDTSLSRVATVALSAAIGAAVWAL